MAQIFISYSRQDANNIQKLADKITAAGHGVWLDREGIRGGEQWRRQIVQAIMESDVFMLTLSPSSIGSENVRKELDLADEQKAPIIPVIIKTVTIPDSMQYQLAGLQRVDLATSPDAGFRALLAAIEPYGGTRSLGIPTVADHVARVLPPVPPNKNISSIAGWLKRVQEERGDWNLVNFNADKPKNIWVSVSCSHNSKFLRLEASPLLTPPLLLSQSQRAAIISLGYEQDPHWHPFSRECTTTNDYERLVIAQEIMRILEIYGINPNASIRVESRIGEVIINDDS